MKKILLTVVAVMAFSFGFAETKSKDFDRKFDMSCDIYRLATVLDLDERQMDAVEEIQENFSSEMKSLSALKGPWLRHQIHQVVRKDAQQMRKVLNDKQFHDYMRIIFATLRNRNL
jgi:hypothetical protein